MNDEARAEMTRRIKAKTKHKTICPRCQSQFVPYWSAGVNYGNRAKPPVTALGKMLRWWRIEMGYSAIRAAAYFGVSLSLINKIERGYLKRPYISTLKALHRKGLRGPEGKTVIDLIKAKQILPRDMFFVLDKKITSSLTISKIYNIPLSTLGQRVRALNLKAGDDFHPYLVKRWPKK